MNRLLSGLMAIPLAASFLIAPAIPLNAAPVFVPKSVEARTDVEQVRHRKWHHRAHRHWRDERRHWRRHAWRDRRYYDDDYYYHRRHGFYDNRRYGRRHRSGVTLEFSF